MQYEDLRFENFSWIGDHIFRRAEFSPRRLAVEDLDNENKYTYQDIELRANRLANFLTRELNLEKRERIAFLSRNRIEMFDGFFAAGKTGAIFVPYNFRLSVEELTRLISKEKPRIMFYEDVFEEKVEKLKEKVDIDHYFELSSSAAARDNFPSDRKYDEIENYDDTSLCQKELNWEDIHLIMHTGGTTGLPKGAKISHRAVLFNSLNEIITWNINHQDSTHLLLPLFHTGGWNLLTLPLLQTGGSVYINRKFDPQITLEVIDEKDPTFIFGAATIFRAIAAQDEFSATDFSSLRWMMSGAAPTPREVMEKYWEQGVKFCAGYGLTEGGPNNLSILAEHMEMEEIKEKYDSVGVPFYFTEVKIVDEKGEEVKAGEAGELIFSGPQIFSGYWNNEEETRQTLQDGWVYTGDIARQDEEGYYYIVGRKKNMFISGGENVFPPEIESRLYEMPEINEACVIPVPDDKWGEVGKAVIKFKEEEQLEKTEIIDYLEDRLAGYKVPKYVAFIEKMPKNDVGKIEAAKVAEQFGEPRDNID